MSDLPRYELIPSHDSADTKSHRGPAHGDEEQGFYPSSADVVPGASSSASGAAPSRICYSFKPEYPVPGKEEDVVGIRGTSKQVGYTSIVPSTTVHKLTTTNLHLAMRSTPSRL